MPDADDTWDVVIAGAGPAGPSAALVRPLPPPRAALRRGRAAPEALRLAVLEETGHISAVAFDDPAHVESRGAADRRAT